MSIYDTISLANKRWPNLTFKRKNDNEAYSPECPFCGKGDDRYLIFSDTSRYWCRSCHENGKIIETLEERLSQVEIELIQQRAEISRVKREQEKQALQIKAIETMLNCTAHITYHESLPDEARDYWHSQGINDESIKRWKLGYTQHIPLWQSRAGYTIPIINNGKLRNIRYRATDDKKPKYLPHCKYLPLTLFNADRLIKPKDRTMVIIGEGEKKAIAAEQYGFPTTSVLGTNAFDDEWIRWFMQFKTVYVCWDLDALDKAAEFAKKFGRKNRVVELPNPGKLDDCFNQGLSARDFCELLRKAKMI